MNNEIPKPEKIEDGTDLYDGMIFKSVNNIKYLSSLDSFVLNKLRDRLEEYFNIMNDDDHIKGEKLTERLGCFINKYKLKTALNRINFLLIKENNKLDDIDTAIISFMDSHQVLERVGYENLIIIKKRLMSYHSILGGSDEAEKEKFFERMGYYLAPDSLKDMLDYVDDLISEKRRWMQG